MADRGFVHLHCHSHYSLLDGACRIPELVARTKELGMNAVALTDHGNLYGAIELYRTARDNDINPIIGYEAYVAPTHRTDRATGKGNRGEAGFHLTLLAQNNTGFKNLIKMASLAFTEGYYYVPRIDKELLKDHSEGIICLSGCLSGEFNEHLKKEDAETAAKLASWYAETFGKNFFIEIQKNGLEIQDRCTIQAVEIAQKMGIPLVATADTHYLRYDDAVPHDVLICINTGKKRADPNRMRYGDGSNMKNPYYLRSPEDMYKMFENYEDAVARSQEIADSCDIRIDFKARHFPVFEPPENLTAEEYLRELCLAGMKERYGDDPPEKAIKRLDHELGIICRMGFASYFLITWDFVRFAVEQGIPCSARGSGCGAIVSYVLKFSHVDPLDYDLLFERFLDPNRAEAPDIDIDFCQDRREEVIEYVKQKYGRESVAQIATFGTLAAKASIKDVGRVLDVPLERVNFMTKWVSPKPGTTIDDTIRDSPDFRREYENDPEVREWIDIARTLEGTNRNAGTHAAGVVIAKGPITDYVPVHRVVRKDAASRGGEAIITTQWVMGDLEKVGMLKMDFLGLRTLTVLDKAVRLIKKTRGIDIDPYQLPIDDKETYELLQRGDAKGVFQFESEGIRELLKRMKPDNIRDIIACTALYRPGPLEGGLVDDYVACKHGRKEPEYAHPVVEEVLHQTYGIMVFQEDVMRILNKLGGLELSAAYRCIKAISKKKFEIIDEQRSVFIGGAKERGVSEAKAKEIFDLIVKFGGYGFNKSHSAAYAYVSYHTAYLKRHFTPEFMAALLSSEVDDGNKRDILVEHIDDAKRLGVTVRAPDVNESEADFTVIDGEIVFGLTALKGVGRGAAESISRERDENGLFRDLFDFCERIDPRTVTRGAVEKLVKGGALDNFAKPKGHRAQLMAALPRALQSAMDRQRDRERGQRSIFDLMEGTASATEEAVATAESLPDVPQWASREKLQYEKEVLDFYFSSHPLAEHEAGLKRFTSHDCQQLIKLSDGAQVRIGGMVASLRYFTGKRGPYARCKLEDFTGSAECVIWSDVFAVYKDDLDDDKICLFEANVEKGERAEPIIVVTRLMSIEEAQKELTRAMAIRVRLGEHRPTVVNRIASVLRRTPGPCQVFLKLTDPAGKEATLRLGDEYKVDAAKLHENGGLEELEMLFGKGAVVFSGR